jgi:hypothetical protein
MWPRGQLRGQESRGAVLSRAGAALTWTRGRADTLIVCSDDEVGGVPLSIAASEASNQ